MIIEIPDALPTQEINVGDLPKNWAAYENYHFSQQIGNQWIDAQEFSVLRVPSAIIANEFNFLINPQHPDFKQIALKRVEDFALYPRLKH